MQHDDKLGYSDLLKLGKFFQDVCEDLYKIKDEESLMQYCERIDKQLMALTGKYRSVDFSGINRMLEDKMKEIRLLNHT